MKESLVDTRALFGCDGSYCSCCVDALPIPPEKQSVEELLLLLYRLRSENSRRIELLPVMLLRLEDAAGPLGDVGSAAALASLGNGFCEPLAMAPSVLSSGFLPSTLFAFNSVEIGLEGYAPGMATGVVGWLDRGPPPGVGDRAIGFPSFSISSCGGVAGGEGMLVPAVSEKSSEGSARGLKLAGLRCGVGAEMIGIFFEGMVVEVGWPVGWFAVGCTEVGWKEGSRLCAPEDKER